MAHFGDFTAKRKDVVSNTNRRRILLTGVIEVARVHSGLAIDRANWREAWKIQVWLERKTEMIFSSIHGVKAVEYLRHYIGESEARTIRLVVDVNGKEDFIDLTLFGDTEAVEGLPKAESFSEFRD